MTKLFGTDGIRGQANQEPMTASTLLRVAQAAASLFMRGKHRHRVVIGKDTRLSGYVFEPALTAGFISMGMDVILTGPMPTPGVAMLTQSLRADLGVMISASHNPYLDNGVKFFNPDGFKLSDAQEAEIERLVASQQPLGAAPTALGRATRLEDTQGRYVEWVKATLPRDLRLDGLKIVLDCANGAAYRVAPTVLWELGAEVIPLAINPNGKNINAHCGATHPAAMQEAVVLHKADIGLALDGDADRLIVADERGQLVDGDQLLATIALAAAAAGQLKGGGIVATVMSNLGLEQCLAAKGLVLHRAAVGDRHVMEQMRERGCNIGGEQSGHLILADYVTTGDALIAALQVLATLRRAQAPASQVLHHFEPVPQILHNVRVTDAPRALAAATVQAAISAAEAQLAGHGRLLIRKSGTEPLVRIMVEGQDLPTIRTIAQNLGAALQAVA